MRGAIGRGRASTDPKVSMVIDNDWVAEHARKFRLGRKIGSGSFGKIYLGINIQTNEDVDVGIKQVLTNPNWRFWFTANLTNRSDAVALKQTKHNRWSNSKLHQAKVGKTQVSFFLNMLKFIHTEEKQGCSRN